MTMTAVKADALPLYQQTLQATLRLDKGPAWLQELRRQSWQRFAETGFPGRGNEAYKYINLRGLLARAFCDQPDAPMSFDINRLARHRMPEADGSRLVFVNGVFNPELSVTCEEDGLTVRNISEALENAQQATVIRDALTQEETDPFALINRAQFGDGAFVHVEAGKQPESLVQVIFMTTGDFEQPLASYPLSVFSVEAGAKLNLLVQFIGEQTPTYLTNALQQFVVRQGGQLACEFVQNEAPGAWQLAASRALIEEEAQFSLTTMTFGGHMVRHAVEVTLDGERAECHLDGLNVLKGEAEAFHYTVIDHARPECVSRQYYKGILDDQSKSAFNGTIVVRPGAQQTDSVQMNKNLMLSDDAKAYTRPQLQISADDVKCAHGATVGQMDEDQLFYLASRGIDEAMARGILTYGFAEELIQRMPYASLRTYLDRCLFASLRNDGGRSLEKCAARKKFK